MKLRKNVKVNHGAYVLDPVQAVDLYKINRVDFMKIRLEQRPKVFKDGIVYDHIGGDTFTITGWAYGDQPWHYIEITDEVLEAVDNAILINRSLSLLMSNFVNGSSQAQTIDADHTEIPDSKREINEHFVFSGKKTYIMIDYNTGYFKIGYSSNPLKRENTLQCEKPTIELIAVCESDIETRLHNELKRYRIRGEWFDLEMKHILAIAAKNGFKLIKK